MVCFGPSPHGGTECLSHNGVVQLHPSATNQITKLLQALSFKTNHSQSLHKGFQLDEIPCRKDGLNRGSTDWNDRTLSREVTRFVKEITDYVII